MRLYKISAFFHDAEGAPAASTKFVGTQFEAAGARKELIERGARRKDIASDEVDVPTDKAGLMGYLNALVA